MNSSQTYHFHGFCLNLKTQTIYHNNRELKLEPIVYRFILFLVQNHDRIVTKKELMEVIWPNRIVTDSALSRCVYEARKALSLGTNKNLIRTCYGRGFQFKGIVSVRHVENMTDEVTNHYQNQINKILLLNESKKPKKQSTIQQIPVRLGLITIQIDDSKDNYKKSEFINSLANLVSSKLRNCDSKFSIHQLEPKAAIAVSKETRTFFRELNLTYVLEAKMLEGNKPNTIGLRWTLCTIKQDEINKIPVGSYELPYSSNSQKSHILLKIQDIVATRIFDNIKASIGKYPKKTGIPDNLKAINLYLEAEHILSEHTIREGEIAQALLEEAIKLDPEFVDAWIELAWSYYEQVWAGGNGRIWADLAVNAVQQALSIDQDSEYANCTLIIFRTELGETESAIRLAQQWVQRNPSNAQYWYALSYLLRYLGYQNESHNALEKCIKIDPMYLAEIGDPPIIFIYLRDWSKFLQLTPHLFSPFFCYYRGYALWQMGKTRQALSELEHGLKDDPKDNFSRLSKALIHIINKEFTQANLELQVLVKKRELLEPGDSEFTYKEAKLLAMANNNELALERLEKAIEGGFFCFPYCHSDPCFDSIRNHKRYSHIIQEAITKRDSVVQPVSILNFVNS